MVLGTRKRGHAAAGGPALLGNRSLGKCAPPDPPGHSNGGCGVHDNGGSAAALLDAGHAGGSALPRNHSLGRCVPPAPPAHSDGGGGDAAAALLDALGLGSFARLELPAPPDGLDLTAAVEPSSGYIIVSMGGDSITASPGDLAKALSLPLGPVALAAENAPLFSFVEAIAAVRVFVHDRLLLGGTGDGQVLPEETVAALQLVEDGRAYTVDWGWFVWVFLWSDVLVGKRRRCSQYLLFLLMKCQRPDLFSEVDGRFLQKRRTCLILQQQQEADVEEKLVCGLRKNIGKLDKMAASGYVKDQQQRTETEDQEDGNHDNANVDRLSLPSSYASRQQVLVHLSNMKNAVLEKERAMTHTRAEIQHMKEKVKEKDNQIAYMEKEIQKEHHTMLTKISQLEHDKMVVSSILHGCKTMLQESSSAFREYRKMVNEADEKNRIRLMQQQLRAYETINGLQKRFAFEVFGMC